MYTREIPISGYINDTRTFTCTIRQTADLENSVNTSSYDELM